MKNLPNQLFAPLKRIGLIGALLVASSVATPAFSQVSIGVEVGVPPPAPRVEVVPVAPSGYVWAPGFWEFFHGQYVWRRGHFVEGRPGYRWVPENWERRGEVHHFNAGHWDRDPNYHGDHHR